MDCSAPQESIITPNTSSSNWASWDFACSFIITFPRNKFFDFLNLEKCNEFFAVFQFLNLAIFTSLYSSPRFFGISKWATFLKFCMRLHDNIPCNPIFCFFEFRKFSWNFSVFQFLDLAIFTSLYSFPRFLSISNWASFLKFCMRLHNNIPWNRIFLFFFISKNFLNFLRFPIFGLSNIHVIVQLPSTFGYFQLS